MTEVVTPPSFVGGLGIELWTEGDLALGRAEVQPEFFKPGTDRVRMGVLATLVDMVAGSPAHAIINPTVDLRVTLLAPRADQRRDRAGPLPGEVGPAPLHRRDAAAHRRSVAPVRPLGVHVHEQAARRPSAPASSPSDELGADTTTSRCSCASPMPGVVRDGQPRDRAQRRQRHHAGRRAGADRRARR